MKYSLGLDIGITSVGWCVLDLDRQKAAALGVRLFKAAENPKDGSSLALPRRKARSVRRVLRRKRSRMKDIKRLIVGIGMVTHERMEELYSRSPEVTPWELRCAGLDRKLSGEEWARILIHIAKHRGYKSGRKTEEEEKSDETGRVKKALRANVELLSEGYRTVGEMMQRDKKFAEHKRNKSGDYSCTVPREALEKEIALLFDYQRSFGNPHASAETEKEYLKIFSSRLPVVSGDKLERLTGRCELEPDELRAPRASWTADRFILLSKIANIKVRVNGRRQELAPKEKEIVEELAYKKAKVKYKDIRKALSADDDWSFDSILRAKKEDPEDTVFIELRAFHSFKNAISQALGKDYWETLVTTSPAVLDTLACALTYRKTDKEILEYLEKHNIPRELAEAVLPLNFSGIVDLSFKAMNKLIPIMETKGCRYDEARRLAGYGESEKTVKRSIVLPLPTWGDLPVPVGIRAVAQARKVVNAVIRRYGAPKYVRIGVERDLSKTMVERRKTKKEQEGGRKYREELSQEFEKQFGHKPDGLELEKYTLWKGQDGICPYTGGYIDLPGALTNGDGSYAEIDHIIPYSRSLDDSRINKVLTLGSINRKKGNMTPYEYFGGEGEAWEAFAARVMADVKNRRMRWHLLIKNFGEKDAGEMKARFLGDNRYIVRYVTDWLEKNLLFADENAVSPVACFNVMAIAVLRRQWGLNKLKDRETDDLYHAVNAGVIAAAIPEVFQKITEYSEKRERGLSEKDSHFPEPWKGFGDDIAARLSEDPAAMIKELGLANYTEEELKRLKPVIVSMRPERGVRGAAHDQTIRSAKYLEEGKTALKTPLTKVTLEILERMVGKERDTALYEALKRRLEEFGNNPVKAFAEEFRKPTRTGLPGPIVRSIRVFSQGAKGIPVSGGIAYNSSMVRLDVYKKKEKYYAVPYYVNDIARRQNAEVLKRNGIDADFDFVCSIFRRDLIAVTDTNGNRKFGYYTAYDINRSTICLMSARGDGTGYGERISIRTAKSVRKYEVDALGEYHEVRAQQEPA